MNIFKWFVNFEKEEKWLNEMASKGYLLTKKTSFGNYYFDKSDTGNIKYKIDYRVFSNESDYQEYITLFSDSGWKLVYGNKRVGFQYFVSLPEASSEDIFSDNFSKAARYKRFSHQCLSIATGYLPVFAIIYPTCTLKWFGFEYLTPGLWNKTGLTFIKAFLFETPFVLTRGLAYSSPFIIILFYLILSSKAQIEYKKAVNTNY